MGHRVSRLGAARWVLVGASDVLEKPVEFFACGRVGGRDVSNAKDLGLFFFFGFTHPHQEEDG